MANPTHKSDGENTNPQNNGETIPVIDTSHGVNAPAHSDPYNISGSLALNDIDPGKTFYWNQENGRPVFVGSIGVNVNSKRGTAAMQTLINGCQYNHDITPEEARTWLRSDDATRLIKFNEVFDEVKIAPVTRELKKERKEIYKDSMKKGFSEENATFKSILDTSENIPVHSQDPAELKSLQDNARNMLASLNEEPEVKQGTQEQGKVLGSAAALAVANFQAETQQEQETQSRGLSV